MKNAFHFMLEALFILEIFIFLSLRFGYVEKQLDEKAMVYSKFIASLLTSQTRQQIVTINILPYISRSKNNQAMKFGPLIEFTMKNIFLQKSCRK